MSNQSRNGEGVVRSDGRVTRLSLPCGHEGAFETSHTARGRTHYKCPSCGRVFAEDPHRREESECSRLASFEEAIEGAERALHMLLDQAAKSIDRIDGKRDDGEQGGLPGGSTPSLYALPKAAVELQDLIEHRGMNFAVGNVFKACYRLGMKRNVDAAYDLRKIIFFAERELRRIENLSE